MVKKNERHFRPTEIPMGHDQIILYTGTRILPIRQYNNIVIIRFEFKNIR